MAKRQSSETEANIPVDEYTEAERDGATLICEALAENRGEFAHDDADAAIEAGLSFGGSAESVALALAASRAVPSIDNDSGEPLAAPDIWGEAAAQIRELWSPGDSIDESADFEAAARGGLGAQLEPEAEAEAAEDPEPEPEHPIGFEDDAPCGDGVPELDETSGCGGGDPDEDVVAEPQDDDLADVPEELDFDHDPDHDRWAADGGAPLMRVLGYAIMLMLAAAFAPWTGVGRLLGLW